MLAIFRKIPILATHFRLTGPVQVKRLIPAPPRRASTPFLIYFKSRQDYYDLQLGLTDISIVDGREIKVQRLLIMRQAKEEWKIMTQEEKQPYIQEQQNLRNQYFEMSHQYKYQFKFFRPTSPVAIYRNYMVSTHYRKKEGEQTRSYEYKTTLFAELHQKFAQSYFEEPEEVQHVFTKIAAITKMQDYAQQIRQYQYQIPKLLINEKGYQVELIFNRKKKIFIQLMSDLIYFRKQYQCQTTFTDYIRDKVSQQDFAEYQRQIIDLSVAHNKTIVLLEEVLIYCIYKRRVYFKDNLEERNKQFIKLLQKNVKV